MRVRYKEHLLDATEWRGDQSQIHSFMGARALYRFENNVLIISIDGAEARAELTDWIVLDGAEFVGVYDADSFVATFWREE